MIFQQMTIYKRNKRLQKAHENNLMYKNMLKYILLFCDSGRFYYSINLSLNISEHL